MKPGFFSDYNSQNSGRQSVDLQFTADSSGDPDTYAFQRGISDVDHSATGTYIVTLDAPAVALFNWSGGVIQDTFSKTGATKVTVGASDIAGAGTVTLFVLDGDGDKVDLATDDVLMITFEIQWNNASARGVNT